MGATSSRALRTLVVLLLALPLAAPVGAAFAQDPEPTVEWLSVDSGSVGGRELPATSADGRYVVFVGRSSADMGVYVRDRVAGETHRITSGSHFNPDISPDGTMVAYAQYGGSGQGIYVIAWQEPGATPELVSLADQGGVPGVPVDFPSLSQDGRYVAFQAYTSTLDDDALPGQQGGGPSKVYVRDRMLGDTEMVSVTSDGQIVNGNANRPAITPDGRYVVFSSDASVLAPVVEDPATAEPLAEEEEEETVVHVHRHDRTSGETTIVSVASDGTPGDGSSATGYGPTISDEGMRVAFESDATNLVIDDTNGNTDAFVHDFGDGSTLRVSVDETGDEVVLENPDITVPEEPEVTIAAPPEEGESVDLTSNVGAGPAISGDGTYVAFESDAALTADDLNTPEPVEWLDVEKGSIPVYTSDVYRVGLEDGSLVRSSAAFDVEGGVEATGLRTDGMTGLPTPANNGVDPTINVDGRLVAFVGNGNLNGEMPPPEEEDHEEITPAAEPTEDPVLLWEPTVWGRWDPTINATPLAGDDEATTRHGRAVTIDVLENDTDPNLDPLTITAVTTPVHGTATIAEGGVTYVPDDGYVGSDTFSYTVDDGYGGTDTATVAMTVTNAAPVARADTTTATTGLAKVVSVLVNDADADGDVLTITDVGSPEHGTATIAGSGVTYVSDDAFVGDDTFTYMITDGIATATATVTVTVRAVDDGGVGGDEFFIVRTYGATRVETAVELSRYAFPNGSDVALLARSDLYPDALAGSPLAKAHDAPILLTPPDQLVDGVADELTRLGVTQVFLLGGEDALQPAVEAAVETLGADTTRIAGPTRFETAARIAARVVALTDATHAYVAEGADPDPTRGWPDALAVSALAAYQGHPILLVTTEHVPSATAEALTDLGFTSATVAGGPVAVSDDAYATLDGLVGTLDRVFGADRWATSAAIADASLATGASADRTWVVTGLNWPDALVTGPLAAREDGVLLLVHGADLAQSPASQAWLEAHADEIGTLRIVGGPDAIAPAVATAIDGILP